MIEHLRGRQKALEPLGWTGREAEWIALVCLHGGIFTRAAVENENFMFSGGSRPCRILSKPIYRALGVENIRYWWKTSLTVVMRRLLSLDYVLEHPELAWLPTEPEKVGCFGEHHAHGRSRHNRNPHPGRQGNRLGRRLDDAALAAYLASLYEAGRSPAVAGMAAAVRFQMKLTGKPSSVGPVTERVLVGFRRKGAERGRGQVAGIR